MSRIILPLVALALLVLVAVIACGCTQTTMAPAGDLKKFTSVDEIRQYIKENTAKAQEGGYGYTAPGLAIDTGIGAPQKAAQESSMNLPAPVPAGGTGYSQTNVQVSGVDEPDIVKNDAQYIYTITGSTLVIVDAYPAATASIESRTEIDGTPMDLFVTGDRLVLFTAGTEQGTGVGPRVYVTPDAAQGTAEKVGMPMPPFRGYTPVTHAIVYDIHDRAHPAVLKDYAIDGNYIDARMIGFTVYMVTREQIYPYYDDRLMIPALREGTTTVVQPDVYYFDNPEREYTFTTITALDATSGRERDAKTYLLGSGNVLYVSPDAMYVTFQKYHNVVYPVRGGPVIAFAEDASGSVSGTTRVNAPVIWEDFNKMSEQERQAILQEMKNGEQEAIRKMEIDQTTTVIHKIAIRDGTITYLAHGELPGYLKNQFALDEHDGNLRVATTSDVWTQRGQYEYNSVFVLNGQMETVGSLTHIAEQEKIYATRFIGDRLYMVTFKRIDPFFVIDLSSPEHPKVLGKLKIPGYSDYLHPYDATHLIGIGKETGTNDWGGVSTRGLKIALFDVNDVEHPKQIDHVEIGDAGSDSAALSDHHAFLFDKNKNLLVIPVRAVTITHLPAKPGEYIGDRQTVWYGVYAFGVKPDTGFVLKGTVTHGISGSSSYWYGSSPYEVKRSLYIDSVLYTLSSKKILANSLDNLSTTIKEIDLSKNNDIYYPLMKGV